ncbi:MAG: Xaa-Pro peptidase family protein [Candidatus Bipolaricaulota bacterium]|nr:Xaa-Pro peptidase family protein [Candidatus Bipolaricaulota bacterium]MCS7273890.1 Xaa-Pro peptidase family protein [Candidatus Bipolaricaulota bacterium]MDW8110321.1 Xaa-Pro peptidase family protein [Candidatus Bipolaricaulota bacterium]MDW8328783.1 Xaa-Pro peptidase family protein [Candidatus Bipolaricaulota bacterium]
MNTYTIRLERLRDHLRRKRLEGFCLVNVESSDRSNLYYLTGFSGSFGTLLVTKDRQIFLTDSRYITRARETISNYEVLELKGRVTTVATQIKRLQLKNIAINSPTTSTWLFHQLRDRLPKTKLVPVAGLVETLRTVKDDSEIQAIERAIQLTDQTFEFILGRVKPGVTERELAWEIEKYARTHGAEALAFPSIVAAGAASAMPHYEPQDRPVQHGDFLLFDLGLKVDRYCADLTRTVVVGRATSEQKKIYNIVLEAQLRAIENLRAGLTSKQADAPARETIKNAGYGQHFGHGTGHGLGLDVHEGPRLSPLGKDKLQAGNVVTIEPGIYLPGWGGVRIEDVAVIEEQGCRVLTRAPKKRLMEI